GVKRRAPCGDLDIGGGLGRAPRARAQRALLTRAGVTGDGDLHEDLVGVMPRTLERSQVFRIFADASSDVWVTFANVADARRRDRARLVRVCPRGHRVS